MRQLLKENLYNHLKGVSMAELGYLAMTGIHTYLYANKSGQKAVVSTVKKTPKVRHLSQRLTFHKVIMERVKS